MGGGTIVLRSAVCLLTLLLLHSAALAEKRVALLIGNEAYASVIGRLANPRNDVALLEQALKGLGFEVVTVPDAGLGALHQAINTYARRAQAAGPSAVGFFYYSGHGASDGTTNYLIPVDVRRPRPANCGINHCVSQRLRGSSRPKPATPRTSWCSTRAATR